VARKRIGPIVDLTDPNDVRCRGRSSIRGAGQFVGFDPTETCIFENICPAQEPIKAIAASKFVPAGSIGATAGSSKK